MSCAIEKLHQSVKVVRPFIKNLIRFLVCTERNDACRALFYGTCIKQSTCINQSPSHSPWKHFRCTIDGPDSSYSCLEIHICWKVDKEAKMEPPIQTEYLRSGGAMILIFMVGGARAAISFCIRSEIPGYIVEPPERTVLA
ncbi:hypothetical protein pdam_00019356 [Pocillopora damicornis]|uniref:Uncharacterized protein n=1 Tax=Pocillopora damicornis TaxID=46731 RepID=A0A3M6UP96_POCDA|nr:hypothetical protein pdam_00019356 [Pocillopora damicornis]